MTITDDRLVRSSTLERQLRDVSHTAYMAGNHVLAETLEEAADQAAEAALTVTDKGGMEWDSLEDAVRELDRLTEQLGMIETTLAPTEGRIRTLELKLYLVGCKVGQRDDGQLEEITDLVQLVREDADTAYDLARDIA